MLATGETYTVRMFIEKCFKKFDIDIIWSSSGVDEKGHDKKTGKLLIQISEKYFRPCEVDLLLGDPTKAVKEMGWKREFNLDSLIDDMFL